MQCAVCSVQCRVYGVECAVWSVECAVCSVQCTVCTVQANEYSVHCTVCTVQCALEASTRAHRPLYPRLTSRPGLSWVQLSGVQLCLIVYSWVYLGTAVYIWIIWLH